MNRLTLGFRSCSTLLISCLFIISCSKKEEDTVVAKSNQKAILSFKVAEQSAIIDEAGHSVKLLVPYEMALTAIKPEISISPKASISPASKTEVDLSSPVTYTVVAEDGTKQEYIVSAERKIENKLLTFSGLDFWNGYVLADIDTVNYIVNLKLPFKDMTSKVVDIMVTVSPGAKTASGLLAEPLDLTTNVVYSVIGADGKKQDYLVRLVNDDTEFYYAQLPLKYPYYTGGVLSSREIVFGAKRKLGGLASFIPSEIDGLTGANFGVFTVLENEVLTNMKFAGFKVADGATVTPSPDLPQDFSKEVTYTITSPAGTVKKTVIRPVRKKILTAASNKASLFVAFSGSDMYELDYLNSTDISTFFFVDENGKEFAADIQSTTTDAQGVHTTAIKAKDVLPKGSYRLKVVFSDNTTDVINYVLTKS